MDVTVFSPRLAVDLESLVGLSLGGTSVDGVFDLAALSIVVACFLFIFVLLWALERV
jgi:hypothetical protein